MKKIILLAIILLSITGCNSGQLTNTCTKEETVGSFKTITTYTIQFKNDNVNNIDVSYDYQDSDTKMITTLKQSRESENRFLTISYEVLQDSANQYKVVYHISNDSDEEMKKHFNYQEKRTKFVRELNEQGFTCK